MVVAMVADPVMTEAVAVAVAKAVVDAAARRAQDGKKRPNTHPEACPRFLHLISTQSKILKNCRWRWVCKNFYENQVLGVRCYFFRFAKNRRRLYAHGDEEAV